MCDVVVPIAYPGHSHSLATLQNVALVYLYQDIHCLYSHTAKGAHSIVIYLSRMSNCILDVSAEKGVPLP